MKKILSLILTIVMVIACMTGCNLSEDEATVDGVPTLKYIGLKVYDPVYIALEKGMFDKSKVNVELVDLVAGGATAVQMIESRDADAGLLSYMALVNAVNEGMSVTGITDLQSSFEEAPLEEFFVRKDSGIKNITDLKGKKIAINLVKSSFHYTWLMELEKAGMSEDDVEFVVLSFDQQILALKNGQVDAIGLMSPYSAQAFNDSSLTKMYDATDTFGERQFCDIIASTKYGEKYPEALTAFVDGITKAMKWAEENQEEAKKIIEKHTGIDAALIADYKFQENGAVIMEDVQYWLDYMKAHGNIKPNITADMIATNKYNREVK